jgi:glycosyltransferase involved in cell wall biosynthesis
MLGPEALQFSRRRKQLMWSCLQKRAVQAASCLHATSEQEYQDIRKFGLRQPIAVVPNGVDVPPWIDDRIRPGLRTVLYLGRIHPKKGLDRLVNAWAHVERLRPHWTLRLVGPDENGYLELLRRQASQLGLSRISFEAPLFGQLKCEAYQAAEIFVLPTLNENFAMTVAEALAHGTPVICTKGAPWRDLETNGCGWWISHDIEVLAETLIQATSREPQELITMGKKGREWMLRDFSWKTLAAKMADVYRWLSEGGATPDSIHCA